MGKDHRNIDRGRRKIDDCDCQEYELNDANTLSCGYCGDPPAKHISLETPNPEIQVQENGAAAGSSNAVLHLHTNKCGPTEPWKNTKLGWIPDAKRKTGIFYNDVLKSLYASYWPYCGNYKIFRNVFMCERNRQYLFRSEIENVEKKIDYIKSENPACAGNFLTEQNVPLPGDKENLIRLTTMLEDNQKTLGEIVIRLEKDDEELFCQNGRLKSGRQSFHRFNEDMIYEVKLLDDVIAKLRNKLLAVKDLCTTSCWESATKRKLNNKQRKRQNKWKCEKRTKKRKLERCNELFRMLGGDVSSELKFFSPGQAGVYQITEIDDLNDLFPGNISRFDTDCLEYMLEEGFFRESAAEMVERKLNL